MKCRTCAADVRKMGVSSDLACDATHIAMAGPSLEWPVCSEHMHLAMAAGWYPINEIEAHKLEAE